MHFEDTTPEEEQAINFQEVIRQIEFRSIMMEELGITEPITFFSRTLLQATFPHSYRMMTYTITPTSTYPKTFIGKSSKEQSPSTCYILHKSAENL